MIGYLSGEVFEIYENSIILLVNGVGYLIFIPQRTLGNYKKNSLASFYISSVIREDVFDLYGFVSNEEKRFFSVITSVSGIGPKTALAILSKGSKNDIMNAVSNSDLSFFAGVPRLGKKNAQKLIIELKNKSEDLEDLTFEEKGERKDIRDALISFGYQEKEISKAILEADKNGGRLEEKIAFALKILGRK